MAYCLDLVSFGEALLDGEPVQILDREVRDVGIRWQTSNHPGSSI